MAVWIDQIEKAKARGSGQDLRALSSYAREKAPIELGTPQQLIERHRFIQATDGDTARARAHFERIIAGNDLQDINYLERGVVAARAVGRILIRRPSGQLAGFGTGFLIAPDVLLTNNHVLPSTAMATRSEVQFNYELDADGQQRRPSTFRLLPEQLFFTSDKLDFSVVAVCQDPQGEGASLHSFGHLPLVGTTGKVADGEWLTIVQHPNGELKQICVRENKVLKRDADVLWYSTDTLGGSSGSPAFNNDWYVVALHHSGIPEERDGRWQTIFGQDFDPARHGEQDIKWIANEGIRVSRIVQTLQQALADHPLLQPVFAAGAESAAPRSPIPLSQPAHPQPAQPQPAHRQPAQTLRLAVSRDPAVAGLPLHPPQRTKETPMPIDSHSARRTVTVSLGIDPDGSVTLLDSSSGAAESASLFEAKARPKPSVPTFDVPFNARYDDRDGYLEDFLESQKVLVHLPELSPALEAAATRLIDAKKEYVLKYHNFSVVMHAKRRFAIYTAANVDFGGRYEMGRPTDVWREDPRIPIESQVTNFYYAKNQFDRGHLTRREDLEFGSTRKKALQSAADTCHWTNCTPQHAKFNQNKELWQGIERHLLEGAIENDSFRAQVITGPILEESDPIWERFKTIQYPVRFWKVVCALNANGDPFATAYLLDQTDVVDQYGIEAAPVVPFTAYKTFQVPIADVERLTQLQFSATVGGKRTSLSNFDPLAKPGASRRRKPRHRGAQESAGVDVPENFILLESFDDIAV